MRGGFKTSPEAPPKLSSIRAASRNSSGRDGKRSPRSRSCRQPSRSPPPPPDPSRRGRRGGEGRTGPFKGRSPLPLPQLLGSRAFAPPLKPPFRSARGGFRRRSGHEVDGGARHLPRAAAAADRARAALAPRPAAESRDETGSPREDRDHARPRRRDALLRRALDRTRQARRRGPAGHAPGRLLADGEGPGAQALPGAGAPLRSPPGRLHADGAGSQERQPGPGREGGDRVQGQPAAATAAAPPGRREDAGQPAAEGLPGGAGHGRVTEAREPPPPPPTPPR